MPAMPTPASPTPHPSQQPLVLASTSRYRAESLRRLQLTFNTAAPMVDEAHLTGEPPERRAARLAKTKAQALSDQFPNSILIGSDQVASCRGEVFDKPGTMDKAVSTLKTLRGQSVDFHTAVCVYENQTGICLEHTDLTCVQVRADLTDDAITRYVQIDSPLDCAGAFKVETLGISLFDAVRTDDPTALIGLPLIALAKALRELGLDVP